jgi:hypothetical protein
MGRPSEFSQEIAEQVIDRVSNGEMLTKICTDEDMPARMQFYNWMTSRPALVSAYARARLAWADWWAEKVLILSLDGSGDIYLDEAGKSVVDHANVQRARLQVDTIKWLVGKYAPRTYGEKPAELPTEAPQQLQRLERVIIEPEGRLLQRIRELEAQLGIQERDEAPRQLTFDPGPFPTRLHGDIAVRIVGLVKARVPDADQRPPEAVLDELMGVIDRALIAQYGEVG